MFKDKIQVQRFVLICIFIFEIVLLLSFRGATGITLGAMGLCIYEYLKLGKSQKIDFSALESDINFTELIISGNKTNAVKYCRTKVNCGLKEALNYVEDRIKN